ncbi:MAG: TonB-dependent siderophore receptor [Alcanivorax sp.]|uniref:TonB-dependent siderophore receptor n=1 Tax=Alloalcanivorax marinus TaxID=1177169 RepID=UPI001EF93B25|nr:TonB-dependent siderophore receptor [Alloalcanivorax marinus]MBM7333059.1 TonB-dependent siderophore receptor [Alloalcanivorax marinus]
MKSMTYPRLALLAAGLMLAGAVRAVPLDIPAQPLDAALAELAEATGQQLLYDADATRGKRSPALRGDYGVRQALARLLAGSGLRYRINDDGSLTLEPAPVTESTLAPVAVNAEAATKVDTPTLETPQSISVVRRAQIEEQGSDTVQQSLRYTPGVFTDQIGASQRYDYVSLRGFSDDSIDNIYLDGLKTMGDGGTFSSLQIDPYFLERVEIVKGPTSVLYGRASPGGLVNLTSKKPLFETRQELRFGVGDHDYRGAGFDFSGPVNDRVAYRIVGLADQRDTQFDPLEQERRAIMPSLTLALGDNTQLDLMAYYQDDPEGGSHSGVPAEGTLYPRNGRYIDNDFFEGEPGYEQFERTQKMLGYQLQHFLNDTWSLRQNLRYITSDVNLQQVYSYDWVGSGNQLSRYYSGADEQLDAYTVDNQARADFATGRLRHTLLVGVDYQHRDVDAAWSDGAFPAIDAFDPMYGAAPTAIGDPVHHQRKLIQTGVYVQDQIALNRWRFSLGGRQDWVRTANLNENTGARSSQDREQFSGRAGVLYRFDNGLAPYVSYSESFNPSVYTDADGDPLEPTEGTQYETGLKYQPRGGRGLYTLSLFHIDQENLAIREPQSAVYLPVGEIRSRGVELEAQTLLTDRFRVQASYTYTDIEYREAEPDIDGNRVNQAPRNQASAWGHYRFDGGPLSGFEVGAGVRYTQGIQADRENTLEVPAYTLVDAVLGYDFSALGVDGLSARINANNLLDKEYVASCYSLNYCYFGAERSVMATVNYRLR